MASIYDERCCEMLKLEAGECNHPTYSWGWVAITVTSAQIFPELESLHDHWILLIEVLEDHKSLEILVESWDRLEKILEI
jgi:hypothetical protein